MGSDAVVETEQLSKCYGEVAAVSQLNLNVRRGEIYGFLGRNGAGKTTTIRMLLGLVRPSRGVVTVLDNRIRPGVTDVFGRVGYLVESATAYPNLTVRENLEIQRRLTDSAESSVSRAMHLLGLTKLSDRRAGQLSLGNKQRLSLARAMLHEPELLILDEPANALDPAGIVEVRNLLRDRVAHHGVTVFISSHILAEMTHLADRIGIIHEGRLLEELDRGELDAKTRSFVVVRSDNPVEARRVLAGAGITMIERGDSEDALRVFVPPERVPVIARHLVGAGLQIRELAVSREDLEDYFLQLTSGEVAS